MRKIHNTQTHKECRNPKPTTDKIKIKHNWIMCKISVRSSKQQLIAQEYYDLAAIID